MLAAILKVSSRPTPSGVDIIGGTAGTAFSLRNKHCVTCHHVVNDDLFSNPPGYSGTRIIFAFENGTLVEIGKSHVKSFMDKDLSIISHPDFPEGKWDVDLTVRPVKEPIKAMGYYANLFPPKMAINSEADPVLIQQADTSTLLIITQGIILAKTKATLNTKDIRVKELEVYKISAAILVGMSGGPLLSESEKILGLISFGVPEDVIFKTERFAVWSGAWAQEAGL
jgi:hypothetical protein